MEAIQFPSVFNTNSVKKQIIYFLSSKFHQSLTSSVSFTKKKETFFKSVNEENSKIFEFLGIDNESGLIYLRKSIDYDDPKQAKFFLLYGKLNFL